jgi:hypothetical protein
VAVGVGEDVNVGVTEVVRVTEAVTVGGRGVSVEVGSGVGKGVGVVPPQAVNSKIVPRVSINIFFIPILDGVI